MSKLYGSYSDIEPHRETERNGSYADHVRRPVMVDPEGRKGPNIQYRPGYVMTTERVVEHVTRAPVISFISHQGRPYMETGPNISRVSTNYGADDDEPEMDKYGYPQPNYGPKMENFITKIQTEVSKPQPPITKVPGPFTSNWRAAPTNNHSQADDGRPKKIQNVPIGNHSPQKMQNQPRFGVPPKEVISYSSGSDSDTIDSGDARKRYAKLKPQPVPEKAINSDDLIKKYNGAKVPR